MYLDLTSGNQNKLILIPDKDSKWIDRIIKKYPWEKYDMYDNRLYEYMEHLFDNLTEKFENDAEEEIFWDELTLGQKMFFSFLVFEGQVDNGGVFQFFWNKPEHAYSLLQVLDILNLKKLKQDYSKELIKYENITDKLNKLKEKVDLEKDDWEDDFYKAYEKGLKLFGEESKIEDYFYEDDFKKKFHEAMSTYIEKNQNLFVSK